METNGQYCVHGTHGLSGNHVPSINLAYTHDFCVNANAEFSKVEPSVKCKVGAVKCKVGAVKCK